MCVLWHSPKYTCSIFECIKVLCYCFIRANKNSIVVGFMYIQVSYNVNFTMSVSHIFMRSITRSRIDNDVSAVDSISFSILARFAMNVSHVAWDNIIWLPLLSSAAAQATFPQRTYVLRWCQYPSIYKRWRSEQIFFPRCVVHTRNYEMYCKNKSVIENL